MSKRLQSFVAAFGLWLFLVGLMLLYSWPWKPRIVLGLVSFLVLGPLLYVAGEGFFSWLFSPEHGHRLSRAQFSLLRVLVALVTVLLLFGGAWFIEAFISRYA